MGVSMEYTFYQLLWLYLFYSFIGWCVEVCAAAIKKREFINRGFVTGPLCPIYGTGAVLFAVFLPELKSSPFFLFLGGMILASLLELVTGKVLEKIFKRKWWDYSEERFSFEGYVCLKYSLLWGCFAMLLLYLTDPLLLSVIQLIPHTIGVFSLIALFVLLVLDFIGTWLALAGMKKQAAQLSPITDGIQNASRFLENAITRKIRQRMKKAYPPLSDQALSIPVKQKSTVFAEGCSFYKLIVIFFIGAFLGDIIETVFCFLTMGEIMSRSSVVYGPFSIVWGLGCAFLTALLYLCKEKDNWYIFWLGTLLGGAYEYICSVFTELVFGTIFWDYSGFAFNLGGRINLLYCFFWGIAAVIWLKLIYPRLSALIEKIPMKTGKVVTNLFIVFMVFDMVLSSLALARYTERHGGDTDSAGTLNTFLDEHFPDERIERVYPNAKIVE